MLQRVQLHTFTTEISVTESVEPSSRVSRDQPVKLVTSRVESNRSSAGHASIRTASKSCLSASISRLISASPGLQLLPHTDIILPPEEPCRCCCFQLPCHLGCAEAGRASCCCCCRSGPLLLQLAPAAALMGRRDTQQALAGRCFATAVLGRLGTAACSCSGRLSAT